MSKQIYFQSYLKNKMIIKLNEKSCFPEFCANEQY